MSDNSAASKTCVIVGASHAGVNHALALRKNGWAGDIILYDVDPTMPYHRPPLSKAYLTEDNGIEKNLLKSAAVYQKANITLKLGIKVESIDRSANTIYLSDKTQQHYNKLVLACGARPIIPPIKGIESASQLYPLRTAMDVENIKAALKGSQSKRIVVIGGGYIGLETAASLKKLGASVTVLEREERLLARVTAPVMSDFFQQLHTKQGVEIFTGKNVISIESAEESIKKSAEKCNTVKCDDGSSFDADIIIVGVGIWVNKELAEQAGLTIENGIKVDSTAQTKDQDIYAIGDCTCHFNPHYGRYVRLESVQNAVDQAKIAAESICGLSPKYDTLPWFWSDQYDVKLQMVGLSSGYDKAIVRKEANEPNKFSVWYFAGDTLLAVDAVNHAKSYVLGTKLIKSGQLICQNKLVDETLDIKEAVGLA